jgi:hypothetical protein
MTVRVSSDWLSLREPADAEARSAELVERLGPHPVIHDLGGGAGAMGRWLAPRLPGPQHWVIHDRDADLLELAMSAPPASATVEARQCDITRLEASDVAGAHLVTASALLDLLTADELARMLDACAGLPMLLTLTVVGGVALDPADPLDARIGAAFNDHQRRDGRLGPDAVEQLPADVLVRPSPWRLNGSHGQLTGEWLRGWVGAACEQDPTLETGAYLDRRLAQAAAGELAVTVDHADVLVLPC